ncbi:hypothetical protein TNCV_4375971, partial [Trichonephila clavipes]
VEGSSPPAKGDGQSPLWGWSQGVQHHLLKEPAEMRMSSPFPLGGFHIYTDGSTEDAIKNAAAGAYSISFYISYPVEKMKLIELEKSKESIAFQIPSYCNISGNEKADKLAKAGSLMSQPESPFALRNIKGIIYSELKI